VKTLLLLVVSAGILAASLAAGAGDAGPSAESRIGWWRQARFGMFIHWGPVSLTGKELSWSRANSNTNCPNNGETPIEVYDNLYKRFDPTNFDANQWVRIARTAGMKYMVFTAKHCDGFLLWDSKVDSYNMGATPFHRDVCAELARAAHEQNEPLGWYFSPMDWRDPDCRSTNNARFVKHSQAELRELLSHYGKIAVVWFDSDGRPALWDPANTYAIVHELQPQSLVDNRLEMETYDQWAHQGTLLTNQDFYTPEQRIGAYDDTTPWETCMTLGTQWAWKPEDTLKTPGQVIHILAECAGGGGNLLLDVGPMPDGRIEPRQADILAKVGAWLAANGESIYGTRGGPWKPTAGIASVRRGNAIYVHILRNRGEAIELPDIAAHVESAAILGGGPVNGRQENGALTLVVPMAQRGEYDTVVKLSLTGSAMGLAGVELPATCKATASNVYGKQDSQYGASFAFDGDEQSRWAADDTIKQAWVAVDFLKPQTVNYVRICEAYPERVRQFELQSRENGEWKTLLSGTALGASYEHSFAAVTSREFRLNILDATQGPTISEIEFSYK